MKLEREVRLRGRDRRPHRRVVNRAKNLDLFSVGSRGNAPWLTVPLHEMSALVSAAMSERRSYRNAVKQHLKWQKKRNSRLMLD